MEVSNVFLVGPMGAGKTTIGKILASDLHFTFIDTDYEIEKKAGVSISIIFEIEGETGFRQRETKVLEEIASRKNQVVATGGGIVLKPENRELIKGNGCCVYLSATAEQLVARVGKDRRRPLLQSPEGPENVLRRIVDERDPLYREVANLIVPTNSRPPRQLAKEISRKVKSISVV